MKKRILSALLSATLVVASVSSITAMAAGDTVNGTAYEYNTFTANKITHPENGLKARTVLLITLATTQLPMRLQAWVTVHRTMRGLLSVTVIGYISVLARML